MGQKSAKVKKGVDIGGKRLYYGRCNRGAAEMSTRPEATEAHEGRGKARLPKRTEPRTLPSWGATKQAAHSHRR